MMHLTLGATNPFPDQSGELRPGLDPEQVTPGALGFFATLFMVLAVVLLMRSMAKRVRRVRYRELTAQRQTSQIQENGIPARKERSEQEPEKETVRPLSNSHS